MPKGLHINRWLKGLDRDSSTRGYPSQAYYDGRNIRIIGGDNDLDRGAVHTMKGNDVAMSLPSEYSDHVIIGWGRVGKWTILFSTKNTTDPTANKDVIWKMDLENDEYPYNVYEGYLNLSTTNPIYNEVIGYYSNEDVQKVYWTDNYNFVRNINIADPDASSLTPGELDLIPDADMTRPSLYAISGGDLPVGMVQYAYQLYRHDGAITTFSPASGLIHLTKSSENDADDSNYQGADAIDEDGNPNSSGKAVTVQIDGVDTSYDRIRVVNIVYTSLYGEPSINVVADVSVRQTTVQITDNGGNYQENVSLNMFRSLGGSVFKAKTLENKNNILFAGNIEESEFDIDDLLGSYWDARAYRFNGEQTVKLYKNVETTDLSNWTVEYEFTYTGDTGTLNDFYDSIPEDADVGNITNCSNKTMDERIDSWFDTGGNTGSVYVYQKDGSTLGGEGLNISYEFVQNIVLEENWDGEKPYPYSPSNTLYFFDYSGKEYDYTSYASTASPLVTAYFRGFKSDEIYSFGIQFFNTKKQRSFVKWIGDVRFPRLLDTGSKFAISNSPYDKTFLYPFGIKFTIDFSTLPNDITHFQIVRCQRTSQDKTVVSQGMAYLPMIYDSSPQTLRPHWYPTLKVDSWTPTDLLGYGLERSAYICQTPGMYHNNDIESIDWVSQVIRIEDAYIYDNVNNIWDSRSVISLDEGGNDADWVVGTTSDFFSLVFKDSGTFSSSEPKDVIQQSKVSSATHNNDTTDIGFDKDYVNWYETRDWGGAGYGPHADSIVFKLDSDVTDIGGQTGASLLVDLKKERIPYGGYSYSNRLNREYIPCGDIKEVTGATGGTETYEGDNFIGYFENIKDLYYDSSDTMHIRLFFPCETSVNPKLVDRSYSLSQKNTLIYKQVQQKAGVYQFDDEETLTQDKDFYRYNTVFSKQPNAEINIPKPDKKFYVRNKHLVKASNVKSRFSLADEWTNFASGNELMLEARYGDLNKLLVSGNTMVFFQENGLGTLSVNERALTQTTSDVELALGSSGILSRFDYISHNVGLQHTDAIVGNDYGVFWYDQNRRKFWSYRDGLEDITQSANMNNYFSALASYSDNMFTGSGIVAGHNVNNNEIWLTFYDGSYLTLVFNYMLRKFSSFIDNSPLLYLNDKKDLYDVYGSNTLYKYDRDTYTFYGSSFTPYITFIIAPVEAQNSLVRSAKYDVISWLSQQYSGGSLVHESTIDTIKFENDHQDSGEITVVPYNSDLVNYNARRFNRLWRYNTIRDSGGNRMTDYYLMVTMKWSNNRLTLHEVQTIYRSSG